MLLLSVLSKNECGRSQDKVEDSLSHMFDKLCTIFYQEFPV